MSHKQAKIPALRGGAVVSCLGKIVDLPTVVHYCQFRPLLSLLIRNGTEKPIMDFVPNLEAWNLKFTLPADKFFRKLMFLRKNECSWERKKNVLQKDFFQASWNPERKREVYKMKVAIKNSAIKSYHEFHLRLHRDLQMQILATTIF